MIAKAHYLASISQSPQMMLTCHSAMIILLDCWAPPFEVPTRFLMTFLPSFVPLLLCPLLCCLVWLLPLSYNHCLILSLRFRVRLLFWYFLFLYCSFFLLISVPAISPLECFSSGKHLAQSSPDLSSPLSAFLFLIFWHCFLSLRH